LEEQRGVGCCSDAGANPGRNPVVAEDRVLAQQDAGERSKEGHAIGRAKDSTKTLTTVLLKLECNKTVDKR
jgi:hypothetical protein